MALWSSSLSRSVGWHAIESVIFAVLWHDMAPSAPAATLCIHEIGCCKPCKVAWWYSSGLVWLINLSEAFAAFLAGNKLLPRQLQGRWDGLSLEQMAGSSTFSELYPGGTEGSWATVTRMTGRGPVLLILPENGAFPNLACYLRTRLSWTHTNNNEKAVRQSRCVMERWSLYLPWIWSSLKAAMWQVKCKVQCCTRFTVASIRRLGSSPHLVAQFCSLPVSEAYLCGRNKHGGMAVGAWGCS